MGSYEGSVGTIDDGGATSCTSYEISGVTVYIILTKACTCLARPRNALGEMT